jgi:hypothetical protein
MQVVFETTTSKQKLATNQSEFFKENFLIFYLIIFRIFSLVSQIFVQNDIIYFCEKEDKKLSQTCKFFLKNL